MHAVPSARRTPVLAALLAALLAVALLPARADAQPADPADGPDLAASEAAAAAWLVRAHADGEVTSGGGLTDLILALGGADAGRDTVLAARAELEAATADYLADGGEAIGTIAKALLGIRTAGGDAGDVDGTDLEQVLRDREQADGDDAGRFGDASVFVQALAIMALEATEEGAPASAQAWLAERRCPDGGYRVNVTDSVGDGTGVRIPCMQEGAGDVDTTALALMALRDADAEAADRDGALAWLQDQQAADGGFGENANSTGLAGQALRAYDDVEAADAAAAFVTTLQKPAGDPEAGAYAFTADDDGSLLLATTQGILALGAPAIQDITAPGAAEPTGEACADDTGVTVVVDLTAFGGDVQLGCAEGDPASGLDALRGAGFDVVTQSSDFGEFVCAIEGRPEAACDEPFAGRYWAYSSGELDGSWTAYQVGADQSDPRPGDVEGWAYSEGEGPAIPAPGATVERIAGDTRIATAVRASRTTIADDAAGGAVLAVADAFPDALAGTPLAVQVDGPLLLTAGDALPQIVGAELLRALPDGATVTVLGGEAAVSAAVVADVEALGFTVRRIAGPGRVETAIAIARELGDPGQLLLTTGSDFADALAAGTAAGAGRDGAVLLVGDGQPHPAVDAYLAEREDAEVVAVGGPAAAAYPDVESVTGDTREATAVAVAERFFTDPSTIGVARRDGFADALAGGAVLARLGGPLLITPTEFVDPQVRTYICLSASTIESGLVFGGEQAVSTQASIPIAQAIAGSGCE